MKTVATSVIDKEDPVYKMMRDWIDLIEGTAKEPLPVEEESEWVEITGTLNGTDKLVAIRWQGNDLALKLETGGTRIFKNAVSHTVPKAWDDFSANSVITTINFNYDFFKK